MHYLNGILIQKVKNGNPVLCGRFHTDIKTGIIKKPLFEMPDITAESRKPLFLIRRLDTIGGFNDCGNEKSFMNIDNTIGLIDNFHEKQLLS